MTPALGLIPLTIPGRRGAIAPVPFPRRLPRPVSALRNLLVSSSAGSGPSLILGAVLWLLVLRSGLHATVAAAALAILLRASLGRPDDGSSPLHRREHALQPCVAYGILPVFGFAHAAVSLAGLTPGALLAPSPSGSRRPCSSASRSGCSAASGSRCGRAGLDARGGHLAPRLRRRPAQRHRLTMSLFIGGPAFAGRPELDTETTIGAILGSVLSTMVGALVLSLGPHPTKREAQV